MVSAETTDVLAADDADALAADNADVLAADNADVLAADTKSESGMDALGTLMMAWNQPVMSVEHC